MQISEEYRKLNKELHQTNEAYGVSSSKWVGVVSELIVAYKIKSVLDYGCGKGKLSKGIGVEVENKGSALNNMLLQEKSALSVFEYDPCIEGKDSPPSPAEMVVCTDVLEHIEPECLDAVLDHIQSLATKGAFLTVAMRPAKKILADGRNAHLIQEGAGWWLPKLMERFKLIAYRDLGGEFLVILEKK